MWSSWLALALCEATTHLGRSSPSLNATRHPYLQIALIISILQLHLNRLIYSLRKLWSHIDMAEVLGVVASGVSVVQIAGQLLSCIQGLRVLCRALRDTPGELQGILDDFSAWAFSAASQSYPLSQGCLKTRESSQSRLATTAKKQAYNMVSGESGVEAWRSERSEDPTWSRQVFTSPGYDMVFLVSIFVSTRIMAD
jgi:hypothetical protein